MRRRAAAAGRRRALLRRARPIAAACPRGVPAVGAVQGSGGAATQGQATLYTGLGFDTCDAPSLTTLQAWLASPYRALGIYIGGANRACTNAQLSRPLGRLGRGDRLGDRAALRRACRRRAAHRPASRRSAPSAAAAEGTSAADDAIASASQLGLPAGSPIYFDMEGYALDNAACTQTVQTFLSAWVAELHGQGYLAGVYGSAASTMRDLQALTTTSAAPDDVWIADWNGDTSVFGDPYVSDGIWTNHQRIHQFSGGHRETYGGVTLDIDGDSLDGAVVGQRRRRTPRRHRRRAARRPRRPPRRSRPPARSRAPTASRA